MTNADRTSIWRSALLLLGAYTFGVSAADVFHELGHSYTIWFQGGSVTGFCFHPFNSAYCYGTYVPNHLFLYAGGIFLGTPVSLLLVLLGLRFRTPYMMPLIMTVCAGLIPTGWHMLRDHFFAITTDTTSMIEHGMPMAVLIFAGVVYVFLGWGIRIFFLPLMGVQHGATVKTRTYVYLIGIMPYYLAGLVYACVTAGTAILPQMAFLISAALLLVFEAWLSKWAVDHLSLFGKLNPVPISWKHLMSTWLAASTLIIVTLLISQGPP